jgi:tetratricopeptide (TPR) repeat protein
VGAREPWRSSARSFPQACGNISSSYLEQLSEADQALLEAASVAGSTFAVAAVATGIAQAPETLEARYTALARQGRFLRAAGTETWPDGTVTACYQSKHALYHEVVYARVSAGHRMRLHQQIGARKEAGYGAQARQIAAELAVHFTRGRDTWRAVHYLQYAGENALGRSAYQEAITHLTTGLEVLKTLPETPEHTQIELALQTTLGPALMAHQGFAAPEVAQAYARARALRQHVGDPVHLGRALCGLRSFYNTRGDYHTARELGEALLTVAQRLQDAGMLVEASCALGNTLYYLGEFVAAYGYLTQGWAVYDRAQHHSLVLLYGNDPGVGCLSFMATALWMLGYPDQAVQQSQEALRLANEIAHLSSRAFALTLATALYQHRGEVQRTHEQAEALLTLACERGGVVLRRLGSGCAGADRRRQRTTPPGAGRSPGHRGGTQSVTLSGPAC